MDGPGRRARSRRVARAVALALGTCFLAAGMGCAASVHAGVSPAVGPAPTPARATAALAIPGVTLLHQVSIRSPGRTDVIVGRLSFLAGGAYHLEAALPFGVSLFTIDHGAGGDRVEVVAPLAGRFPADGLARDITRIYLVGCPEAPGPIRRCTAEQGALSVEETVDLARGAVTARTLRDRSGRLTEIRYGTWGEIGGLLHPKTIDLESGAYAVRIVLTGVERSPASAGPT